MGDFFGILVLGNEVVMMGSIIVCMSFDGWIVEEQDFMDYMVIFLSMRKGIKIIFKQF